MEIENRGWSDSDNYVMLLKITVHQHPRQLSQPRRDVFKSGQRGEIMQSAFVEPKDSAETIVEKIILLPSIKRGVKDRKSTRLNSSHQIISYAVFCLKKKIECPTYWK